MRKVPAAQHDWQTKRGVLGSSITVIRGMALFTSTVGRKRKASRGGRGNVDPETRPEYAIFESADPSIHKQRESRTLVLPEYESPHLDSIQLVQWEGSGYAELACERLRGKANI